MSASTKKKAVAPRPLDPTRIARLAFSYWEARGRPYGSPDEDWFRAEEEFRRSKAAFAVVKDRRRTPRAGIPADQEHEITPHAEQ